MQPTKLSQAIFTTLTALTLTACGSSDSDIDLSTSTPTITPSPIITTPTTPAPTTLDEATKRTRAIEFAKLSGLTEANALAFAEKVLNLDFGSNEYNEAIIKARQEQTDAINAELAKQAQAVSPIVDSNNPFIGQVDVREIATVSSNHYVRQQGSTYDLTANPTGIAGLGGVATDDPTTSNPWLTNYVLGTEVVRDGTGKPTIIAIDSAGEMVEPLNDGTDRARKLGVMRGSDAGYSGELVNGTSVNGLQERQTRLLAYNTDAAPAPNAPERKLSPYYATYDGLRYRTQSSDGQRQYNYGGYSDANPDGLGASDGVWTLQEQATQHGTKPRQTLVDNALLAAKGQNYNQYPVNPNEQLNAPLMATGKSQKNRGGNDVFRGYGDYTRAGLIVYNDGSAPVGHEVGQKLGYLVPMWGREENVYQLNKETGRLEVINGVNVRLLSSFLNNDTAVNLWNAARYASDEKDLVTGLFRGCTRTPTNNLATCFIDDIPVANNDNIRLFGKNMLGYDAGATGEQSTDNMYIAKYSTDGTMQTNGIRPSRLHHVQYGRLTNNIDVLAESEVGKKGKDGKDRVIYREFQAHGAPNSVDTYFYRGTNHTTLDQMKALSGGIIQYHGHALTYNLGPFTPLDKSTNGSQSNQGGLPTAYGNTTTFGGNKPMNSGNTIGNFVEARFDVAKARLDGTIYNFINEKRTSEDADFKKQDLATFTGTVYGNTVIGTAQKVGFEGTGSLTASFFGPNATEIGGNISSVSRGEGYGDAKWGAVFGATRGSVIEQFNVIETGTNQ